MWAEMVFEKNPEEAFQSYGIRKEIGALVVIVESSLA